eukprot:54365-Pyramimonas_sp.AAC.1
MRTSSRVCTPSSLSPPPDARRVPHPTPAPCGPSQYALASRGSPAGGKSIRVITSGALPSRVIYRVENRSIYR